MSVISNILNGAAVMYQTVAAGFTRTVSDKLGDAPITLKDFGGVSDGVTDNAAAITKLNAYLATQVNLFVNTPDGQLQYFQSKVRVDLTGQYAYSNTLLLYSGVEYWLPKGSRLIALAAGQTMIRSLTTVELNSIYGTKNTSFRGGGYIDGNNLASYGLSADIMSDMCKIEVNVIRCTYRRFSTTANTTSGNAFISLPSAVDIRVNDIVQIAADSAEFYTVKAVSGVNVQLTLPIGTTLSGTPIVHRAAGINCTNAQQSEFDVQALRNDIGISFNYCVDGIQCTDIRLRGKCELNMIGEVSNSEVGHQEFTCMHSFDREIVISGGNGSTYDRAYIESIDDNAANTLIPPVGTAPVGLAAFSANPSVDIKGGQVVFTNTVNPKNGGSTSFRRTFRVYNADVTIDAINLGAGALRVNPNIANDYSLVELKTGNSYGVARLRDVSGVPNMTAAAPTLVANTDGSVPLDYLASWSYGLNTDVNSNATSYCFSNNPAINYQRVGHAYPAVQINPTSSSISFGSGDAAVDTALKRLAPYNGFQVLTIGNNVISTVVAAPASHSATGGPGQWAADASYLYTWCSATGRWGRTARDETF